MIKGLVKAVALSLVTLYLVIPGSTGKAFADSPITTSVSSSHSFFTTSSARLVKANSPAGDDGDLDTAALVGEIVLGTVISGLTGLVALAKRKKWVDRQDRLARLRSATVRFLEGNDRMRLNHAKGLIVDESQFRKALLEAKLEVDAAARESPDKDLATAAEVVPLSVEV